MKKVFKVADIHDLLKQVHQGKISYSQMVNIMNEMAEIAYSKSIELASEDGSSLESETVNPNLLQTSMASLGLNKIGFSIKEIDEACKEVASFNFNPIERWQISKQAKLLLKTEDISSTQEFNSYQKMHEYSLSRDKYQETYWNNEERFTKLKSNSSWNEIYYEYGTGWIHNVFVPDENGGNHSFSVQILREINPEFD